MTGSRGLSTPLGPPTAIRTRCTIPSATTSLTTSQQRNDGTDVLRVWLAGPHHLGVLAVFPGSFKDAAAMPPALRKHMRYPELLLKLQAAVYGLYHMTAF
jgi:hypothetical protein